MLHLNPSAKAEERKFVYIDLFAGCGGLSLGLHNAGWKGLFAFGNNTAYLNYL